MPNSLRLAIAIASFTLYFSFGASGLHAQQNLPQEVETQLQTFFNNLVNRDRPPDGAFAQLFNGGPLEGRTNDIEKLVTRFKEIENRYGTYLESERVLTRQLGKDVFILTYLYKTEKFPVVWRFTWYRPPMGSDPATKWVLIALKFGTQLEVPAPTN